VVEGTFSHFSITAAPLVAPLSIRYNNCATRTSLASRQGYLCGVSCRIRGRSPTSGMSLCHTGRGRADSRRSPYDLCYSQRTQSACPQIPTNLRQLIIALPHYSTELVARSDHSSSCLEEVAWKWGSGFMGLLMEDFDEPIVVGFGSMLL